MTDITFRTVNTRKGDFKAVLLVDGEPAAGITEWYDTYHTGGRGRYWAALNTRLKQRKFTDLDAARTSLETELQALLEDLAATPAGDQP